MAGAASEAESMAKTEVRNQVKPLDMRSPMLSLCSVRDFKSEKLEDEPTSCPSDETGQDDV